MHHYSWSKSEANFGKPLKHEVSGGTHVTFEILLKHKGQYVALRRLQGIPGHVLSSNARKSKLGLLYFCHDLIRYGETTEECVKRIVKDQAGITIKKFRTVFIESFLKTEEWDASHEQFAIIPHIIAEIATVPKAGNYGNLVTEVVFFSTKNVPRDFAWWREKDLKEFLEEFDK